MRCYIAIFFVLITLPPVSAKDGDIVKERKVFSVESPWAGEIECDPITDELSAYADLFLFGARPNDPFPPAGTDKFLRIKLKGKDQASIHVGSQWVSLYSPSSSLSDKAVVRVNDEPPYDVAVTSLSDSWFILNSDSLRKQLMYDPVSRVTVRIVSEASTQTYTFNLAPIDKVRQFLFTAKCP